MATANQAREILQKLSASERKEFITNFNKLDSDEKRQIAIDRLSERIDSAEPQALGGEVSPTERVEEKISQRQDILSPAVKKEGEEIRGGEALAGGGVTAPTALKVAGGVFQRAEAGVAAPALKVLRGVKEERKRPLFQRFEERQKLGRFGGLKKDIRAGVEVGKEAIRGLKGERLVERGDIARELGVPEPIASTLGFITDPFLIKSFVQSSTKNLAKQAIKSSDDLIDDAFAKSIKPSLRRKTASQLIKNKEKSREAIRTIVINKKNLKFTDDAGQVVSKLPESLDEFGQAIQQTKKSLFDDVINPLIEKTQAKGLFVSGDDVAIELSKVARSKTLQTTNPRVASFADDLATRFKGQKFTPQEANDIIRNFNQDLMNFYKSPIAVDPNITRELTVRAGAANIMRKSLDKTVQKATGTAFQPLKAKYGALRSIEDDVTRAISRNAAKTAGLTDYANIFSAGNIVEGVVTGAPGRIARGVTQKGISSLIKKLTNPNRIVKKMFKGVDDLLFPSERLLPLRRPPLSETILPTTVIGTKEALK